MYCESCDFTRASCDSCPAHQALEKIHETFESDTQAEGSRVDQLGDIAKELT